MAGYIECIIDWCLGKLRSYQSTLSAHDVKSFFFFFYHLD